MKRGRFIKSIGPKNFNNSLYQLDYRNESNNNNNNLATCKLEKWPSDLVGVEVEEGKMHTYAWMVVSRKPNSMLRVINKD